MKAIHLLSVVCLLIGVHARAQVQTTSEDQSQFTFPGHGPGPGHGPHPGPGPIHGHPGWHDGGPRPGWHHGWRWDWNHHPFWWHGGILFPVFVWAPEAPPGWWQCTAFDEMQNPFSAAAPDRDEAAYNVLYDCGGPDYDTQCYIPAGYCQFRN